VKFLQTNTNATVLATPQILTLDNTEATFESSEKVPFLQQTVSNGVISNTTAKEDVAISLKLKPAINKMSNFVKLDIEAKLQDFSNRKLPDALAAQAIATTSRIAKTSVVVGDGDTVVLGGLIRDVSSDTTSKVPVLGDIPVLGWLFKSKSTSAQKSNLLIFITPKIVRQYEAVRGILDRKLKERDDFLERSVGGVDIGKDFRDKIIRSLPDVKKIQNDKPQTNFTIDNSPDGSMQQTDDTALPPPSSSSPSTDTTQAPAPVPGSDLPPPPAGDMSPPGFNGG
jgi:type II secretory pathway component GspD/PulD (secretin)